MIPAHDSPLAALAFDASGTKLATASEKVRHFTVQYTGPTSMWLICAWFLFSAWANTDHCCSSKCCHPLCIFHFLPGHSHSCLLNPRGTEALRVSERSQEVGDFTTDVLHFLFFQKWQLFRCDGLAGFCICVCACVRRCFIFASPSLYLHFLPQVCEHLFIGVQYGRPVPVGLQQHRDGPHF